MQGVTRRKCAAIIHLASVWFLLSVWPPVARSAFTVKSYAPLNYNYDGAEYSVYVFAALNGGGETGLTFDRVQATIDTGGPLTFNSPNGALAIDIEATGGGTNRKYSANIDGSRNDAGGVDAGGPPVFGDIVGGTFIGIGSSGGWTPDLVDNPITTESLSASAYVNGQTNTNLPGVTQTNALYSDEPLALLDPAFENNGSVNVGAINNGTVHSLEVLATPAAPILDNVQPVPFANVVVPVGTAFTISGDLIGDSNAGYYFFTDFSLYVPEPTEVPLMAACTIFLLLRRRTPAL